MSVAVATIKQTNKNMLSIKSHSFPTFPFYFIHFFLTLYFFYNSNKSNNDNNKSFVTIDRLACLD